MTQISTKYHVTGGPRSRDLTYLQCSAAYRMVVNAIADFGCLDAPSWLPAGSCASIKYNDWKGRSIPRQSLFDRERA